MATQQDIQIEFEGRAIAAQLGGSDADTEGHVLAGNEIEVDVEGHAMTLRLPNAGDAAAIRRALAIGAVTATLAGGGLIAMTLAQPHAQTQPQVPAAPITVQAAPRPADMTLNSDQGMADQAAQKAAAEFAESKAGAGAVTLPVKAAPYNPSTTGDSSDQDINLAERGRQAAANQAPVQPNIPLPNRDGGSHPE